MVWLFKIFFWEDLTAYIDIESSEEFLSRIGFGRSDLASGYYYSGPTKPIFFHWFFPFCTVYLCSQVSLLLLLLPCYSCCAGAEGGMKGTRIPPLQKSGQRERSLQ